MTKVMRKEARHTQRRDRASGVPLVHHLRIERINPKKHLTSNSVSGLTAVSGLIYRTMTIILDMGGVLMNHNMPECIARFTDILSEETMKTILGLGSNGEGASDSLMEKYERGEISTDVFIASIMEHAQRPTNREEIIAAKEKDGDKTLFRESEASPDLGFTQVMLSIEVFCNLFLFIPSQLIY